MKSHKSRIGLFALGTAGLISLALSGPAAADDGKITLMIGGIEKIIYLPAKLGEQLGYFKEQGLNVELMSEPAGVEAEDELLSGNVQGVIGFYDHNIDLQARGKSTMSVVQLLHSPGEVELVATKKAGQIKSPADWKGANLGVTGLGSSTNFITQYLALKNGVKLNQFTSVPVGAGNTFIAALQQGKIDGGMTTEPTVSRLLKTGEAKILVDMRKPEDTKKALGGLYPASCLYMQTSWATGHPVETQKLANALVKTLKWINTHSPEQIADMMPKDYYVGDKAAYVKAIANGKAMFTPDGRMPADGPATVLKVLSSFDEAVKGKQIDLSKTYTNKYVLAAK